MFCLHKSLQWRMKQTAWSVLFLKMAVNSSAVIIYLDILSNVHVCVLTTRLAVVFISFLYAQSAILHAIATWEPLMYLCKKPKSKTYIKHVHLFKWLRNFPSFFPFDPFCGTNLLFRFLHRYIYGSEVANDVYWRKSDTLPVRGIGFKISTLNWRNVTEYSDIPTS